MGLSIGLSIGIGMHKGIYMEVCIWVQVGTSGYV
jgi:hypothetical protein